MKTADPHQLISTIRTLLVAPKGTARVDADLFISIHHLGAAADAILSDPELFAKVLALYEAVLAYRGKGSQTGALNMSRLLCYLTMSMDDVFSSDAPPSGGLKPAPRPEESLWWAPLQLMITQDKSLAQGPPSRSRHTSRLRADAWDRLGYLCQVVDDPEIRELALKTARDKRAAPIERMAAVEVLAHFVGEDEPDEEIVSTLDELAANPTDENLLRAVLQAQIDLGLESELGASFSMDDWREKDRD